MTKEPRVFVALELPEPLKQSLAELIDGFRQRLPPRSVRWVRPEGIHLTLKYYGAVEKERVPELAQALGAVAAQSAPVRLGVEGLGVFPGPLRPQVIWLGLAGDIDRLQHLAEAVEAASHALGFEREGRAFRPHLTLGRVGRGLRPADLQAVAGFARDGHVPSLGEFEADTLSLMNSQLRPGGSVYTALARARLGAPAEPRWPDQRQVE